MASCHLLLSFHILDACIRSVGHPALAIISDCEPGCERLGGWPLFTS